MSTDSTQPAGASRVVVGRVGKPHGLDGAFYVTRPRNGSFEAGMSIQVGANAFTLRRVSGTDERPILALASIDTREAIEALRGTDLTVSRDDVAPLGPEEFWAEDLEGCVVRAAGREVGTVKTLVGLPSCEALEVTPGGALVPLVQDAITRIDLEARTIDVDAVFLGWPEGPQ